MEYFSEGASWESVLVSTVHRDLFLCTQTIDF